MTTPHLFSVERCPSGHGALAYLDLECDCQADLVECRVYVEELGLTELEEFLAGQRGDAADFAAVVEAISSLDPVVCERLGKRFGSVAIEALRGKYGQLARELAASIVRAA